MSKERMLKHLSSEVFRENIRQLAAFSIQTRLEAGLAAYADGCQQLDLPDSTAVQKSVSQATTVGESFMAGYNSYNPLLLVLKHADGDIDTQEAVSPQSILKDFRDDIDLFIHTHPVNEWQTARERLRPSVDDLISWEQTFDIASPGITEGVLAPTTTSSRLLLWRKDPKSPVIPYYQQLEDDDSAARVQRVMRESRLGVAIVDTAMEGSAYTEQVQQAVDHLFGF